MRFTSSRNLGSSAADTPPQAIFHGIHIHRHQQRHIVQHSRDQGGDHDLKIGHAQHFGDDESGGSHDGGHDLPAGGGGRLYRASILRREAVALHQRDGKRPGADDIGHRAAADGAEETAGYHGHFGRAAPVFAKSAGGQVSEVVAYAGFLKDGPQDDKEHNVQGGGIERRAPHAITGNKNQIDKSPQIQSLVGQEAWEMGAQETVGNKGKRHNDHGVAYAPLGGDKDDHQQEDAEDDIRLGDNAQAVLELLIHQYVVAASQDAAHQRDAKENPQGDGGFFRGNLPQKEKDEYKPQMDSLLNHARESAEQRCIHMEQDKRD